MALEQLIFYSKAEESFHKQKYRVWWIKEGDSNTQFFHQSTQARFNRNKILSLTLENGARIHELSDIHDAAVSHFEKLFSDTSSTPIPTTSLASFVTKSITLA